MTATDLSPEHEHDRRAIAAHFSGRTSAATEASMRAHLVTCAWCKDHYQRHLTLSRLDPRGLPAADRIARGLGFRVDDARDGRWFTRMVAGLAIPIAIVMLLAIVPRKKIANERAVGADGDFVPRGTGISGAAAASFWTYRVRTKGAARLADQEIAGDEELAFAYSNPAGKPFLMIFGVDEHRHVYWFHPAWPVGSPPPVAIRAATGPGPHELPDAIHQTVDGQRLKVYAAFSEHALDATMVEAIVRAAPTANALPDLGEGIVVVERKYEVQP
jgi:hypothetical protein